MRSGPFMSEGAQFFYSGIRVRNLARSLRFYRAIGFRLHRRGTMPHGGKWVHLKFGRAEHRLELNYYPPGSEFFEPHRRGTEFDHFGFWFANINRWVDRAERAGAKVVAEVPDGPNTLVYLRDPDGNWLEFIGPAAKRAKKQPAKNKRR